MSEHDFFNIALASRSNTTKVVESVASITWSFSLYLKKTIKTLWTLLSILNIILIKSCSEYSKYYLGVTLMACLLHFSQKNILESG